MRIVNYFLSILLLTVLLTAAPGDQETALYKAAYKNILDENWKEAGSGLRQFLLEFPESRYADDARFWQCYTMEQLSRDPETAFGCYDAFAKAYPESNWADDARNHMIRLAKTLSSQGKAEYREILKTMQGSSDNDVAIAAIYAIGNMEKETALETLLSLFEKSGDEQIREKILFSLAEIDDPRATAKLKEVAAQGPGIKLRKRAIFWLGDQIESEEVLQFLKNVARTDADIEIREHALFAVVNGSPEKGLDLLLDTAKNDKNQEIRKKALFFLGEYTNNDKAVACLKEMALNDPDPEIAKQALFALSESGHGFGEAALIEMAKNNTRTELRKQAVLLLAGSSSEKSFKTIRDIALNDPDQEVAEQALFALSDLDSRKGMPVLQEIARKHPDSDLRRKAVFWIGDNAETPDDITLLKSIIEQDANQQVREHAIFAIAEAPGNLGLDALIDLAKNNQDTQIRSKAIFWLGESRDPRAKETLMEIINQVK